MASATALLAGNNKYLCKIIPSNFWSGNVIEKIVGQADKSQTDKGRINIIVEKR